MGKDVKVQTGKNEPKDWLNEYFYFDAEGRKARKENQTNEKWDATKHSLEENLKKFKECQERIYQAYLEHLKVLSNNAEDPIKYLNDGIKNLQESLDNEYDGMRMIDITELPDTFDMLEKLFNPQKIGYLTSKRTTITESLFDYGITPMINPEDYEKRLEDAVSKGSMTEEHANNYKKVFKALSTDAPNLGVDKDTLDIMTNIGPVISNIEDGVVRIAENARGEIDMSDVFDIENYQKIYNERVKEKDPFVDKKNPYNAILLEGRKISEKIKNYVSGKSTDYPTDEDFINYYNKLENKIRKTSLVKKNGEIDQALIACFSVCEEPSMFVPSLKERYQELSVYFKQKILEEYKKNEDFVFNGGSQDQRKNEFICYQLSCLQETPKELFTRHNLIRIFESKNYRAEQLEAAQKMLAKLKTCKMSYVEKKGWTLAEGALRFPQHPVEDDYVHQYEDLCKTIFACKMADYEQMRYTRYMETKQAALESGNVYDLIGTGYNEQLYPIFTTDIRIEGEFADYLDSYFNKVWNLETFKSYLDFDNYGYGSMKSIPFFKENEIASGNTVSTEIRINDKDKFLNHVDAMESMSKHSPEMYGNYTIDHKDFFLRDKKMMSILRPLTQLKGNKNKNSKEYTELTKALTNIGMKSASIDGVNSGDYLEVFNKADRYLNTHETRLSGKNGQARVTASFKLLYSVGAKLAAEAPTLKDELMLKMKAQMLRDSNFRDFAIAEAGYAIRKATPGKLDAITYMNLSNEDKAKVDVALETLSFCNKIDALLAGTKEADRIKGIVPKNMQDAQAVYTKYQEAFKYDDNDFLSAIKSGSHYAAYAEPVAEETGDDVAEMETRAELLSVQRSELSEIIQKSIASGDDNTVLEAYSHLLYMSTVEMQKGIVNANAFNNMLDPQLKAENVEKLKPIAAKMLSKMSDDDYKALGETDFTEPEISKQLFTKLKLESKNAVADNKEYDANLQKNGGEFKRKDPEKEQPQLNMI